MPNINEVNPDLSDMNYEKAIEQDESCCFAGAGGVLQSSITISGKRKDDCIPEGIDRFVFDVIKNSQVIGRIAFFLCKEYVFIPFGNAPLSSNELVSIANRVEQINKDT